MTKRVLVTGAAGFVGRRLVAMLKDRGLEVRGADREDPGAAASTTDDFRRVDLRDRAACREAVAGVEEVYHLAAETGGVGPLCASHASVCRHNTRVNLNLLEAASEAGVERFLFPSSASVYPQPARDDGGAPAMAEEDAWPADPEPGHGEEKLYAERLCAHYRADEGLETRVVRLQDVYGPGAAYEGGGETELAALCREVAVRSGGDTVTLWGDGRAVRSYLHLDDCVEGLWQVMRSGCPGPVNLAADRTATVEELAELIVAASGKDLTVACDPGKPGPGQGRILDAARLRDTLEWRPRVDLEEGVDATYRWVEARVRASAHRHPGAPHIP